jgi:S1-C subfamily serine protease
LASRAGGGLQIFKAARIGAAGLLLCLGLGLAFSVGHRASADDASANQSIEGVDPGLQPVNSTKALKTAETSVVRVLVVYRGYGGVPLDTVGMGSGFVVAPGYIVTNYHVVEVPPEASSADVYIVPHKDSGATYQQVQVVKTWTEGDLAVLHADNLKIPPLKLYLSPYKNERVVSMGYPDVTDHLLNRTGTELLNPTDAYVTQGSIALFAATNPDGSRVETLFHTASINHGNSGGPLLNECGQVVGVNTWTAPSTVSAGGDVDISSGQFVATHVSALNSFLASAGVQATASSDTCYAKTEDEIVKDDALTKALNAAADAQAARLAEQKKAEADRAMLERWQLAAMVLLSILVLILIGLIIRREIRHRHEIHLKEKDAPTAFSNETPSPAPIRTKVEKFKTTKSGGLKHPIPWGWILLGVVVVAAVAMFLIKDRDIYKRLTQPKTLAPVSALGSVHMTCQVDAKASRNPIRAAGPIEFDFDAQHACINKRTPYQRQADGTLLSFTVNENEPVASRKELSADGSVFKRSEYRLDPVRLQEYVSERKALGSLRCVTTDNAGASDALDENLSKVHDLSQSYLTVPAETETVWRCTKANG